MFFRVARLVCAPFWMLASSRRFASGAHSTTASENVNALSIITPSAISPRGYSTTGGREKQTLFPQRGQRHGVYAGAETQASFAIVEQGAGGKTLAGGGLEPAQAAQVGIVHRGGGFDFHARQGSGAPLDHNVYLPPADSQ